MSAGSECRHVGDIGDTLTDSSSIIALPRKNYIGFHLRNLLPPGSTHRCLALSSARCLGVIPPGFVVHATVLVPPVPGITTASPPDER